MLARTAFARLSAGRSFATAARSSAASSSRSAPLLALATTTVIGLTAYSFQNGTEFPTASAAARVALCDPPKLPVEGIAGTKRERTFLAVKPDGVQRLLVGDIISRFEKRGYKLVGLKLEWPTAAKAAEHYADLSKKPFFPGLVKFFSSGPIVCMCWEGLDVIKQGRQMLGETQPLASKPGSIRGDYSIDLGRNICHGSDSPEAAKHELTMWFPEGVQDYERASDKWLYEK